MKKIFALCTLILGSACSNAELAQLMSNGHKGTIECFSGGHSYYHGTSTGKIYTEKGSDGWYFEEEDTKQLIRVSGSCIVRN